MNLLHAVKLKDPLREKLQRDYEDWLAGRNRSKNTGKDDALEAPGTKYNFSISATSREKLIEGKAASTFVKKCRRTLKLLENKEYTTVELAEELNTTNPTAYRVLAHLVKEGLVKSRKEDTAIIYKRVEL